ncbi:protein LUTEIN DEFICIENT 5, chloroplastic isoform X2 [Jatropha curcas]|uniref:protein LUTEIN DEFICIENT 5, chloroplastic isoform X2 n=1 Tax=Jatropha curcas TaxID=180498 RepID=UPI0018940BE4|nr:protein LUTEIN DEFICIENT 5, chloroplastic isoform X2 [Jatropha curcas]
MFATFETVVAVAMLVRRFNFQIALGAPPVKMTTGATIHTTEGLKMTITRRTKPPIIPNLDMPAVKVDAPVNVSGGEPQVGQKAIGQSIKYSHINKFKPSDRTQKFVVL